MRSIAHIWFNVYFGSRCVGNTISVTVCEQFFDNLTLLFQLHKLLVYSVKGYGYRSLTIDRQWFGTVPMYSWALWQRWPRWAWRQRKEILSQSACDPESKTWCIKILLLSYRISVKLNKLQFSILQSEGPPYINQKITHDRNTVFSCKTRREQTADCISSVRKDGNITSGNSWETRKRIAPCVQLRCKSLWIVELLTYVSHILFLPIHTQM